MHAHTAHDMLYAVPTCMRPHLSLRCNCPLTVILSHHPRWSACWGSGAVLGAGRTAVVELTVYMCDDREPFFSAPAVSPKE